MAAALKVGSVLSVVIVFAALVYKRNLDGQLKDQLSVISDSLLRAEKKHSVSPKTRVAIGLGGCEDVFVDGIELLETFGLEPPDKPIHHDTIESRRHLTEMFAYFFRHGAAAERYMADKNFFMKFVDVAKELSDSRRALGGNAPVMANRLAIEGCDVLLGASMSDKLMSELKEEVQVTGSILPVDDVHLIMEYKSGERWGKYTAPRANRFIVHSDVSNPMLESLEDFKSKLPDFQPHLLVIGGLQMMDNFPSVKRKERITELGDMLKNVPRETRIHFEMASFAEEDMMDHLYDHVLPYSDSLGMNEQELANLHTRLNYGNVTLVADAYPRVATVLDQMRMVYNLLHKTLPVGGQRRVTRIHTHTLAFQAILTTKGSAWKNTMAAAAKASLTAYRHVCALPDIDTTKARLIMDDSFSVSRQEGSRRIPLQPDRPVSCWSEQNFEICIAPVLVCTEVIQTAGGGDNVSSAGLVLQI
ncbi:ADP-dependent glucokinase-like [Ptychodera flava]|uniref:ADP-dependent glucokinase-like n=1 Tax=Ptychodera flava TaxID=63121 RepID=UPI00396A7DDD